VTGDLAAPGLRPGPGRRGAAAGLAALVRVRLAPGAGRADFEARLRAEAGVAEAWRLAGDCDFEVRLACPSLAALDAALTRLREAGGITSTTLVLHRVCLEAG
jgi:DNA-binding Lrp family transcriptional regulator